MNIAWSIGFICLDKELEISTHMRIAWFIAASIGSLGGVLLGKRFGYKLLMVSGNTWRKFDEIFDDFLPLCFSQQFCSMFVLLGGVLFATTQLQPQAMLVARYLNGLANGLALPCSLAMAGELAVCYKRGRIASVTEQMSCTLGIFIQIVLSVSWSEEYDINVDHLHGILCCIYGGLALCLATVYSIESPVDLLAQGDHESAIAALIRLQYPQQVTTETDDQLTEHNAYLSHNRSLSSTQAWCQALPALLRLCLLRMLYAMSTSILVVYTLTLTSSSVYGYSTGPFVLFGLLRLAGSCGGAFVQDTLGRKLTQLTGFMVCSVGSIGLARRLTAVEIVRYADYRMALWLLLMFQLFAGFGFAPSSVYLTEAFPRSVKRMCIAIAYILELGVQLATFMLPMNLQNTCVYFYGLGIFQLIGFLFSHWYLPETKFMTLRQAQQKFRDFS